MYSFNVRLLFRILHSFACYNPTKQFKEEEFQKLWVAEAYRTIVDRFKEKDDRVISYMEL
jgi:hypothetical protein